MMSRAFTLLASTAMLFTTACAQEAPKAETPLAEPVLEAGASPVNTGFTAPDSAWRDLDQDNLLYIDTDHGLIVVELAPEFAPRHVAQVKALARTEFYDRITFHRVIDGFMNQTGDPTGTGTGDSDLPDIEAEFTFRRDINEVPVNLYNKRPVDPRNPSAGTIDVGFYKAFPVATKPSGQAVLTDDQKVEAWGLHCSGVTSMARSTNPNSANSQFFLMRGTAGWLDQNYSIWGNTVYGREHLTKFKVGTKGETAGFVPDQMNRVRVGSDLPASEQLNIQVLRTNGKKAKAFRRFIETQKTEAGSYKDICEVEIPSRLAP